MEVGVNGNVLSRSYPELSHLATHSWFKILWQYSSSYDVKIFFHDRFHIQPTRERDISIIDWFIQHGFSDGRTVDTVVFSRRPRPSHRTFSWERPTPSDF
eukprot:scaffold354287_cov348-Cyclotella_meneghiniana.AAC.1